MRDGFLRAVFGETYDGERAGAGGRLRRRFKIKSDKFHNDSFVMRSLYHDAGAGDMLLELC